MFSSIRIAMILVLLAGAGGAFLYVKNLQKNYTLEDEGSLTKYLGVDMQINNDGTMELK